MKTSTKKTIHNIASVLFGVIGIVGTATLFIATLYVWGSIAVLYCK